MFKHKQVSILVVLFALISSVFIIGCEEDSANNLAQAQQCFDNLPDTGSGNVAAGDTCLNYISGDESTQAYTLRCGLYFWQGGLRGDDISAAFTAYDAAPDNQKEATLIDNLAMSSSDQTAADTAYNACLASETAGLIYIASLVKLATLMEAANTGSDGSAGQIVDDCLADTTTCNSASTGQLLVTANSYYCTGEATNSEVCETLRTVIEANGTDYAQIATDFLNTINF